MALTQPRRWLIAYDIRDPRRLTRIHRLLTRCAVPVQYSVFTAGGTTLAMRALAAAIAEKIDARVDDVRIYPLPEKLEAYTIGASMLPEAALLVDHRDTVGPVLGRSPAKNRPRPQRP